MTRALIGYSADPVLITALEAHGVEAWTCDLLPSRGRPDRHLQCDVWDVARDRWDWALFHPMCTWLTCSAAWAFNDPDFVKYPGVGYHQKVKPETLTGGARRKARAMAIENFRRLLDLPYPKAIENPGASFVAKAIRPADQLVQPYNFGDDASKLTGLWLDRLPKLKPTAYVKPRLVCPNCRATLAYDAAFSYGCEHCGCEAGRLQPRWANQTDSGQNRVSPSADRWLERSVSYAGIMHAMADQWGRLP